MTCIDVCWSIEQVKAQNSQKRYNLFILVYYEIFADIDRAIEREKQIKGGSRQKKIKLIEELNPSWEDLYGDMED
jgi:putative endonuclease